jgi:hypothetical protein
METVGSVRMFADQALKTTAELKVFQDSDGLPFPLYLSGTNAIKHFCSFIDSLE